MEPSNISAYHTIRLYELWFEQSFFDGKLSIRGGQMALDEEFVCSDYAALFVSGTCGWPAFLSATVPSGGLAYPVAGIGVRVKVTPIEPFDISAAVAEGDVGDVPPGLNRHGTDFTWSEKEGVFVIVELACRLNQEKDAKGLVGTYKLGGWYHSGAFDHLRRDSNGLSLEDDGTLSGVASSGIARTCRSNGGIYFNIDQVVFREKEGTDEGLGLYVRVAPWMCDACNTMDFYAAGGLTYKGLFPTRDDDTIGVAVNYCRVSDSLRDAQRDANAIIALGGTPNNLQEGPIPDYELSLEVTYQLTLAPCWTLQPVFQYYFHPGGSTAHENAVVAGLRTTISS
ncbi:MAG: carbohydrate porin [Verrucomicrobiae bacterium]|nr:carbohydrate porin [Verrucomicrobiae bacterium]